MWTLTTSEDYRPIDKATPDPSSWMICVLDDPLVEPISWHTLADSTHLPYSPRMPSSMLVIARFSSRHYYTYPITRLSPTRCPSQIRNLPEAQLIRNIPNNAASQDSKFLRLGLALAPFMVTQLPGVGVPLPCCSRGGAGCPFAIACVG